MIELFLYFSGKGLGSEQVREVLKILKKKYNKEEVKEIEKKIIENLFYKIFSVGVEEFNLKNLKKEELEKIKELIDAFSIYAKYNKTFRDLIKIFYLKDKKILLILEFLEFFRCLKKEIKELGKDFLVFLEKKLGKLLIAFVKENKEEVINILEEIYDKFLEINVEDIYYERMNKIIIDIILFFLV